MTFTLTPQVVGNVVCDFHPSTCGVAFTLIPRVVGNIVYDFHPSTCSVASPLTPQVLSNVVCEFHYFIIPRTIRGGACSQIATFPIFTPHRRRITEKGVLL